MHQRGTPGERTPFSDATNRLSYGDKGKNENDKPLGSGVGQVKRKPAVEAAHRGDVATLPVDDCTTPKIQPAQGEPAKQAVQLTQLNTDSMFNLLLERSESFNQSGEAPLVMSPAPQLSNEKAPLWTPTQGSYTEDASSSEFVPLSAKGSWRDSWRKETSPVGMTRRQSVDLDIAASPLQPSMKQSPGASQQQDGSSAAARPSDSPQLTDQQNFHHSRAFHQNLSACTPVDKERALECDVRDFGSIMTPSTTDLGQSQRLSPHEADLADGEKILLEGGVEVEETKPPWFSFPSTPVAEDWQSEVAAIFSTVSPRPLLANTTELIVGFNAMDADVGSYAGISQRAGVATSTTEMSSPMGGMGRIPNATHVVGGTLGDASSPGVQVSAGPSAAPCPQPVPSLSPQPRSPSKRRLADLTWDALFSSTTSFLSSHELHPDLNLESPAPSPAASMTPAKGDVQAGGPSQAPTPHQGGLVPYPITPETKTADFSCPLYEGTMVAGPIQESDEESDADGALSDSSSDMPQYNQRHGAASGIDQGTPRYGKATSDAKGGSIESEEVMPLANAPRLGFKRIVVALDMNACSAMSPVSTPEASFQNHNCSPQHSDAACSSPADPSLNPTTPSQALPHSSQAPVTSSQTLSAAACSLPASCNFRPSQPFPNCPMTSSSSALSGPEFTPCSMARKDEDTDSCSGSVSDLGTAHTGSSGLHVHYEHLGTQPQQLDELKETQLHLSQQMAAVDVLEEQNRSLSEQLKATKRTVATMQADQAAGVVMTQQVEALQAQLSAYQDEIRAAELKHEAAEEQASMLVAQRAMQVEAVAAEVQQRNARLESELSNLRASLEKYDVLPEGAASNGLVVADAVAVSGRSIALADLKQEALPLKENNAVKDSTSQLVEEAVMLAMESHNRREEAEQRCEEALRASAEMSVLVEDLRSQARAAEQRAAEQLEEGERRCEAALTASAEMSALVEDYRSQTCTAEQQAAERLEEGERRCEAALTASAEMSVLVEECRSQTRAAEQRAAEQIEEAVWLRCHCTELDELLKEGAAREKALDERVGALGKHERAIEELLKEGAVREVALKDRVGALGDHERFLEELLKEGAAREVALEERVGALLGERESLDQQMRQLKALDQQIGELKALDQQVQKQEELEEVNQELRAQIAVLNTDKDVMGTRVAQVGGGMGLQQAVQGFNEAIQCNSEVSQELRAQIAVLNTDKDVMGTRFALLTDDKRMLDEQVASLMSSNSRMDLQVSELREREAALEHDMKLSWQQRVGVEKELAVSMEVAKEALGGAEARAESARIALEEAQDKLYIYKELADTLCCQLKESDEKLAAAQAEASRQDEAIHKLQEQVKEMKDLADQLAGHHDLALTKIEDLRRQRDASLSREELLEVELNSAALEADAATRCRHQQDQELHILHDQMLQQQQAAGLKLDHAKSLLHDLQQELGRTKSQLQSAQLQVEQTKSQLQDAQQELGRTKSQLQSAQVEVQQTKSQLQDAQFQVEQTRSQLQSAQQDLGQTKSQLQDAQQDLDQTRSQLQDAQQELGLTKSQLQDEVEQTKSQLQSVQQELGQTKSQLQDAQQDLVLTRSQLQDAQQELECKGSVSWSCTPTCGMQVELGSTAVKGAGGKLSVSEERAWGALHNALFICSTQSASGRPTLSPSASGRPTLSPSASGRPTTSPSTSATPAAQPALHTGKLGGMCNENAEGVGGESVDRHQHPSVGDKSHAAPPHHGDGQTPGLHEEYMLDLGSCGEGLAQLQDPELRLELVVQAAEALSTLQHQKRKMVKVLKRLGREGSVTSQLDAARKENKELASLYTAAQPQCTPTSPTPTPNVPQPQPQRTPTSPTPTPNVFHPQPQPQRTPTSPTANPNLSHQQSERALRHIGHENKTLADLVTSLQEDQLAAWHSRRTTAEDWHQPNGHSRRTTAAEIPQSKPDHSRRSTAEEVPQLQPDHSRRRTTADYGVQATVGQTPPS
eukprot:gene15715-21827_t